MSMSRLTCFSTFCLVKRISAKDALDAEYFWTDPLPCDPKRYFFIDNHFSIKISKNKFSMNSVYVLVNNFVN